MEEHYLNNPTSCFIAVVVVPKVKRCRRNDFTPDTAEGKEHAQLCEARPLCIQEEAQEW